MSSDAQSLSADVPGVGLPADPALTRFTFDGEDLTALPGQSLGAALLAAGHRSWRTTRFEGRPRGLFCGIGICFDCLVSVNGRPNVRACLAPTRDGDVVTTQQGPGTYDMDIAAGPADVTPQGPGPMTSDTSPAVLTAQQDPGPMTPQTGPADVLTTQQGTHDA